MRTPINLPDELLRRAKAAAAAALPETQRPHCHICRAWTGDIIIAPGTARASHSSARVRTVHRATYPLTFRRGDGRADCARGDGIHCRRSIFLMSTPVTLWTRTRRVKSFVDGRASTSLSISPSLLDAGWLDVSSSSHNGVSAAAITMAQRGSISPPDLGTFFFVMQEQFRITRGCSQKQLHRVQASRRRTHRWPYRAHWRSALGQ